MVNRVILCGILTEEISEFDTGNQKVGKVKIKVVRFNRSSAVLVGNLYGNAYAWALKKEFKAGTGVQVVGSLSTSERGYINLSIDSMQEVSWLTEAYAKLGWETKKQFK